MSKTYVIILGLVVWLASCKSDSPKIEMAFNEDWLFQKGETGQEYQKEWDDSQWRSLNLPHDWAIEGPFSKEYDTRTGGLPVSGIAWYRKHFVIDAANKSKLITIEFDGVMSNAEVFLNGKKVGGRPYGYLGFQLDLTPYIKFGKENILAVRLEPKEEASRWYPGAGIYRNVWLEIKNPVHIAHWGTYITTPEIGKEVAKVNISTTIDNKEALKGRYVLNTSIINQNGEQIAICASSVAFTDDTVAVVEQSLDLTNPVLWDLDNPYLYIAKSILFDGDSRVDNYETTFGVRSIKFTSDNGFLLNGKQVRLNGVCLHHDLGPLGSAVNYRATQRQLEVMKSMGVNAIRTSHNPASPEQLELCDKMGLLVVAEAFDHWKITGLKNGYNLLWDRWHEKDLRDMLRRDRNHPAIIMWSIGNEVKEQKYKEGEDIAKELSGICRQLDPTRPVTAAFNHHSDAIKNGLAQYLDVVGFNYKPNDYDRVLEENSDWIVYGSETSSCVSSRGVYHLPVEDYDKHESLQVSSYDIISPPWAYPPDFETYGQETQARSLGEFVWTGFDYLGEPTPYNGRDNETNGKWGGDWPSRSSYFGIVDLCGFPKDRYYYYQSVWTDEPMVHILPHWNWESTSNEEIPVYCYTNCDEAELFLNGKSLGKKVIGVDKTTIPAKFYGWSKAQKTWDSPYRLNWNVNYEPGELKVVAYKNGKALAEKIIVTAGAPAKIQLIPDRTEISSDGYDLSFVTVKITDENDNLCPLADNLIQFKLDGAATIAAVGNGNPASLEPFQANHRKAFNGLCMLIIRSCKGKTGTVKITASSENLKRGITEVYVKERDK